MKYDRPEYDKRVCFKNFIGITVLIIHALGEGALYIEFPNKIHYNIIMYNIMHEW